MKKKLKIISVFRLFCLIGSVGLLSCIKDKGNYEYDAGNPVQITYTTRVTAVLDEPTLIVPVREFANPGKTVSDYDHEWYLDGELFATEANLEFTGKRTGDFALKYHMIDKVSKIRYTSDLFLPLTVISPYQVGWGVLYEKSGSSEIAHVRKSETGYINYVDLYREKNNGQSLGSLPLRIKDYLVTGGRGLAIVQQGGQGSVELDGLTFEKKMVASESFAGETPQGLRPVNMGFYNTSHLIHNEDGNLYGRLFEANPIPFTIPWLPIPLQISRGMRISHVWDVGTEGTFFTMMHDAQHNRILYAALRGNPTLTNGGFLKLGDIPPPPSYLTVPPNYINPSNLGNFEYIWGTTFSESFINTNCVFLVREPATGNMYVQSFLFMDMMGFQIMHTPGNRRVFTGASLINSASEFEGVKNRNFIFFSGDNDNRNLYYYDVMLGGETKSYHRLPSAITALRQSEDGMELAVGLEDGTVIIYDISNSTLIAGGAVELHRLSGLGGKVADIVVRGSFIPI